MYVNSGGFRMDVSSATIIQQALQQGGAAMSMLKQQAQAEQSLVNMVQQVASGGSRGQKLDITV